MNESLKFSQWLQNTRKEWNIDLRTLGLWTGVSASTLNRLENELMSPTIEQLVLILKALPLDPIDFYQVLTGMTTPPLPIPDEITRKKRPNKIDAYCFAYFLGEEHFMHEAFPLISDWLNKISQVHHTAAWAPKKADVFGVEFAQLIVFGSSLFDFKLNYPEAMDLRLIEDNLYQGGVVIFEDVATYIKTTMLIKHTTLVQPTKRLTKDELKIHLNLKQLSNRQSIAKVKLEELLKFDKEFFGGKGIIPVMVARALVLDSQLVDPKRGWISSPFRSIVSPFVGISSIYLFVLMSRWIEHLELSLPNWLKEVRELTANPDIDENRGVFDIL